MAGLTSNITGLMVSSANDEVEDEGAREIGGSSNYRVKPAGPLVEVIAHRHR